MSVLELFQEIIFSEYLRVLSEQHFHTQGTLFLAKFLEKCLHPVNILQQEIMMFRHKIQLFMEQFAFEFITMSGK